MSAEVTRKSLDWWHAKEAETIAAKAHKDPSKNDSGNARFLVRIAYQRLGTWDAVAQWYGEHSKSAYHRLATDDLFYPSQEFIRLVETHDLPPIRRTIAIPDKRDAVVYLILDGHGDLTINTVPEDCQVAIIPTGALPAPQAKHKRPPYKRPTWAQVRQLESEIARLKTQLKEAHHLQG